MLETLKYKMNNFICKIKKLRTEQIISKYIHWQPDRFNLVTEFKQLTNNFEFSLSISKFFQRSKWQLKFKIYLQILQIFQFSVLSYFCFDFARLDQLLSKIKNPWYKKISIFIDRNNLPSTCFISLIFGFEVIRKYMKKIDSFENWYLPYRWKCEVLRRKSIEAAATECRGTNVSVLLLLNNCCQFWKLAKSLYSDPLQLC